MKKTQL